MDAGELAAVAGAVFVASLVQNVAGFGLALLSVPLMSLALGTRDAVVISTLSSASMTAWQAWRERAHRDRPVARRLAAASYAGMPLGFAVFVVVDESVLQSALGVCVLIAVVVLALGLDLRHRGRGLDLGCGFVAGVLATSLATNGPPLVFALQARRLAGDAFRATIAWVFAVCNALAIAIFVAGGKVTTTGLAGAAVAAPGLVAGRVLGLPVRRHLHGERFRGLVLILLTAAGLSAVVAALA